MLTPKQARFIERYLVHFNATKAATEAGYSAKTAYSIGQRLLKKVEIQTAMQERATAIATTVDATPEKVLGELALIAFADFRTFATWGTAGVTLKDVEALPPGASRCVESISQTVTKEGGTIRLKLHSKLDALEKLARYHKLFTTQIELPGLERGLDGLLEWFDGMNDLELMNMQKALAARSNRQGSSDSLRSP